MTQDNELPTGADAGAAFAMPLDLSRYRQHVAQLDISDERKAELLTCIWQIMGSFVDRAFRHDPTQLARIAGDKLDRERASKGGITIGSEPTSLMNDDGDLAGVFRRCGEGE